MGRIDERAFEYTRRMSAAMTHRGPDQDGTWHSDGEQGVVLGHRRLSIIDLSEAGRQPMVDASTGVALAFNGEIYNFVALRAELEGLGRRFVSATDTEVILAAYLQWGEQAIVRLRGMFTIALWDPREETLVLARDRLGIKPVYYIERDGRFLFASELRALLASGTVDPKLDPHSVQAFLSHGFVPGPATMIEGIRLLDAATILRVELKGLRVSSQRYWRYPRSTGPSLPQDETVAVVRDELQQAVGLHLVSDVPLGVFLSGGVDSSVMAAMAQRAAQGQIATFNVRFEESRYDESPHARRIAAAIGTDHREVTLTESMFADQLDDSLASIDQPTFDALNTYFVSRAVREAGLTVALAGTGGDELFGGYASFVDLPRLRWLAAACGWLPPPLLRAAGRCAARLATGKATDVPSQVRWGKLADALATRGDLLGLYQVSYSLFTNEFLKSLTNVPMQNLHWGLDAERTAELRERIRGEGTLAAISSLEIASFIGERLLRDTDAASMAVSLEVRVPLLDHVFIETVTRVAPEVRFKPARKKALLRELVRGQLDPTEFDRPKAGFELPLAIWCKQRLSPQIDAVFRDSSLLQVVGLNAATVGRLWRAFKNGDAGVYWSRVWSLYVLLSWCRRHGVHA